MDLDGIEMQSRTIRLDGSGCSCINVCDFFWSKSFLSNHSDFKPSQPFFASFKISQMLENCLDDKQTLNFCLKNKFAFNPCGFQSNDGFSEIFPQDPAPKMSRYSRKMVMMDPSVMKKVFDTDDDLDIVFGDFIVYLRWKNVYLAICSTGNVDNMKNTNVLPPVKFFLDRNSRSLAAISLNRGKYLVPGDKIAQVAYFVATDFFTLQSTLGKIYRNSSNSNFGEIQSQNASMDMDRIIVGGWKSPHHKKNSYMEKTVIENMPLLKDERSFFYRAFFRRGLNPILQVSNGWQKMLGDWEPDIDAIPHGMENLCRKITEQGFIPGIWLSPFLVDPKSKFASEHREWILRDGEGKPALVHYNPRWGKDLYFKKGHRIKKYWCLDLSVNAVLHYLKKIMDKIINDWGCRFIKFDHLFSGLTTGVYSNKGPGHLWYSRALKTLTSIKKNCRGEDVLYLGCAMPYEISFNWLSFARVGLDVRRFWKKGFNGAKYNLMGTLNKAFWNQSVFINDPDVFYIRDSNIKLSHKEKELVALVDFLFAGSMENGDNFIQFEKYREEKFSSHLFALFTKLGQEKFGVHNRDAETYFIYSQSGNYAGLINLSDWDCHVEMDEILDNVYISKNGSKPHGMVSHSYIKNGRMFFEKHSINIFRLKSSDEI